jgi:hypothetical protein
MELVVYRYRTWSLTLGEENIPREFESRVLAEHLDL